MHWLVQGRLQWHLDGVGFPVGRFVWGAGVGGLGLTVVDFGGSVGIPGIHPAWFMEAGVAFVGAYFGGCGGGLVDVELD